ncbi:MAG: N-acetyltransferase [Chloroflexi bacterium]|nr:N-acetyltransferase [Chloroflexota bacterium]
MTMRVEAATPITLRNGQQVTIRPLAEDDRAALMRFGQQLPQDDLIYLEDDLQSPEIINRLVNASAAENWRQIVAVRDDGEIVGYSAVRRLTGWSSHVGDIQLMVESSYRRSGLGTEMAKAIFEAARGLGVAKVIVEILAVQTGGRAIFERLGFSREGIFSKHAHDRHGNRHDLVVMAYHVM